MTPNPFHQPLAGLAAALVLGATILGGLLVSLAEIPAGPVLPATPSEGVATAFPIPSLAIETRPAITPTPKATPTHTPEKTIDLPAPTTTKTPTPSLTPSIVGCQHPQGWVPYSVNNNDGLINLSREYGVQLNDFLAANCQQITTMIHPGEILYVPNRSTPTITTASDSSNPRSDVK